MSSKLPAISGREVARILERLGFVRVQQSGSHAIYRRDYQTVVIPDTKVLPNSTLNGLLTKAGVSRDDFLAAMK